MATKLKEPAQPLPFIHPNEMPDTYAITGVGHCMAPLIADGTILVLSKTAHPEPGDIVGVIFTREAAGSWGLPGLVKRLAFHLPPASGGLVVVEQINPARRYLIPSTDVLAVHKAIGTAESDGPGRAKFRPSNVEAWQ